MSRWRQQTLSGLESAVELPLCEKRAGQLESLIGLAQLLYLAIKILDALLLTTGGAGPLTGIDLILAYPVVKGLGHTANLWCN